MRKMIDDKHQLKLNSLFNYTSVEVEKFATLDDVERYSTTTNALGQQYIKIWLKPSNSVDDISVFHVVRSLADEDADIIFVNVYIPLRWVLNKPLVRINFSDEIGDNLSDYYNIGTGEVSFNADDWGYGPQQVMCNLQTGELASSDLIVFSSACVINNWNGVIAYEAY